MIRKNLLQWQLVGYSANHQDKTNLRLHICTVPLTWLGIIAILTAVLMFLPILFAVGLVLIFAALIAQGIGHKREEKKPEPFLSQLDFVSRFFAEQLVTFPRWLMFHRRK